MDVARIPLSVIEPVPTNEGAIPGEHIESRRHYKRKVYRWALRRSSKEMRSVSEPPKQSLDFLAVRLTPKLAQLPPASHSDEQL